MNVKEIEKFLIEEAFPLPSPQKIKNFRKRVLPKKWILINQKFYINLSFLIEFSEQIIKRQFANKEMGFSS